MINFMRYRIIYLIISGTILIAGIFSLVRNGLRPAIDFTGGSLLEIKIEDANKNPTIEDIRNTITSLNTEVGSVQTSGDKTFLIRLKPLEQENYKKIQEELNKQYGNAQELRFETVGPTLGKELLQKTFIAALVAVFAILAYVAWAFKNVRFGVSAIIALLHDLLVVVGIFSILGRILNVEVDALFVTAILTTMSFSVHDTIVVFDRIREMQKRAAGVPFEQQINQALTETMGRSLNNSLTIIFMLLALFLLGGETIKWFILALLIGTISGTYSSPFVATPILYTWHKLRVRH